MTLEFHHKSNIHRQMTLHCGVRIILDRINQRYTYQNQLIGAPDRESNNRIIDHDMNSASALCEAGSKPFMIAPERRDFFARPRDMASSHRRGYLPEWLPSVQCVAKFYGLVEKESRDHELRVITLVWYQNEFAFPILEPTITRIRELDWYQLASITDL